MSFHRRQQMPGSRKIVHGSSSGGRYRLISRQRSGIACKYFNPRAREERDGAKDSCGGAKPDPQPAGKTDG
jgi:hypothetical protein